ncbi:proton-coupled zinc antiporter SLC30A5-like [Sycon ciliatum]|uniref:proton-coupled zinc antiporter SLC30A5-like n=1 Tax=Sycon ciliatum TaxID=27933 RepID=UPI0031F68D5C
MQGVFLHVLADTLGSVGVIVSSILVEKFEWYIADPISSLLISVLIVLSVLPLLKSSALTLLQGTEDDIQDLLAHAIDEVKAVDGVVGYREAHGWQHSGNQVCCTIHVQVIDNANEPALVHQISSILKHRGFTETAVQIEKEAFFRLAPPHITRSFCMPNGAQGISPQAYVTYGPSGNAEAQPLTPEDAPESFGVVVNV